MDHKFRKSPYHQYKRSTKGCKYGKNASANSLYVKLFNKNTAFYDLRVLFVEKI